jgi:hypothetical protein
MFGEHDDVHWLDKSRRFSSYRSSAAAERNNVRLTNGRPPGESCLLCYSGINATRVPDCRCSISVANKAKNKETTFAAYVAAFIQRAGDCFVEAVTHWRELMVIGQISLAWLPPLHPENVTDMASRRTTVIKRRSRWRRS